MRLRVKQSHIDAADREIGPDPFTVALREVYGPDANVDTTVRSIRLENCEITAMTPQIYNAINDWWEGEPFPRDTFVFDTEADLDE